MKAIFSILTLFATVFVIGQQKPLSERQLMALPMDSLGNYINEVFDEDIELTHSYSKTYLEYSKLRKNKENIAKAYLFLIMSSSKSETSLVYCDSLINATKDFNTHKYPAFAYYMKSENLYRNHLYKEALNAVLIANQKITPKTSPFFKHIIKNGIAIMGANNNQHELAINYFHKSIDYFNKEKNSYYHTTLFGLAESHLALKHLDSVEFFIKQGYKESKGEFLNQNVYFVFTDGRLSYQKGDYLKARILLSKSLPLLKSQKSLPNLAINAFWLGKTHQKLGSAEAALPYYKMVDSIFDIDNTIPFELRPAWMNIIKYYKQNGDSENELKYARKLILVDSILDKEYDFMTDKINKEFIIPALEEKNIEEREDLIKSKNIITTWTVVLAFLLGIGGIMFVLHRKREFKRIENYKQVIEQLEKGSNKPILSNKKLLLKDELVIQIEKGLNQFEQNKGYLNNSTTLANVAKEVGTNQRYLSLFINHYKGLSFPEYLNNLRIEYILKRLSLSFVNREDRIRIWSMSEIAKAAGFGSREYYAKAFIKYTKMKHSDYLRQLEKDYKNNRNS